MARISVSHKFIHAAPRKLRLVADSVRGLPAETAVAELATLSQFASQTIRKTVLAALAAAKEQKLAMPVFIDSIMVDEGPKMRRFIPMSRGRSQRILKRMSHLRVIVTDEPVKSPASRAYRRELTKTTNEGSK